MGSSDKKKTSNCNKNQLMMPKYYSKEEMIEIQAEAYYKVYKRIEEEKRQKEDAKKAENEAKRGFWKTLGAFLILIFFPRLIKKKNLIKKDITNSLFSLMSSSFMCGVGYIIRIISFVLFANFLANFSFKDINILDLLLAVSWLLCAFIFGAIFILSGDELAEERDENKIMMYTSVIFALISIIISILAILFST